MRIGLILALLALTVPAAAQPTTTIRDPAGNLIGKYQQRGDRNYRLDRAGNPRGYSVELPNGSTEYRTNAGNLIRTDKPH